MPQINDLIRAKLTGSQYNECVRGYLNGLGAPNYRSVNDGERQALKKAATPVTVNDNWWRYFKETTPAVNGTLNDRKLAFWNAAT